MIDIQSLGDERCIDLRRVGIRKYRMPLQVATHGGEQTSVAWTSLAVELPADVRGTHMSRFVELLQEISVCRPTEIRDLLLRTRKRLQSRRSFCTIEFCCFVPHVAPVTGGTSLLDVECRLDAAMTENFSAQLSVTSPVTSLCPCSKAISRYGAHNQRAFVTVTMDVDAEEDAFGVEECVDLAERSSSSPVFGLLKRPDEKYVTERAYETPRFVEDIARECAVRLKEKPFARNWCVRVESMESIHNHNVFAVASCCEERV